ncbi:MAG: phage holin family protein, partial [Stackebrandtia sp.]
ALDHVMDVVWAALIVTGVWAVIGVVTFMLGRMRMRNFSAVPRRTVETLREDAKWLRHPTS